MPVPVPRTKYRYSANFKAMTVRLSQLLGVSVHDVVYFICIHPYMLSHWYKVER